VTVTYRPAPPVAAIADTLIGDHHPHLKDVHIVYLWRPKAASSKGAVVLGKARKITGLNAQLVAFASPEPLADEDTWETLTEAQRTALVDHELCHLGVDIPEKADKDRKLIILGHDLEEFAAVVERHGLWRPDVETFRAVMGQPSLFEGLQGQGLQVGLEVRDDPA
jgi:hypothetical protein